MSFPKHDRAGEPVMPHPKRRVGITDMMMAADAIFFVCASIGVGLAVYFS